VGRDAWHTLTYTLGAGTAVLYADGSRSPEDRHDHHTGRDRRWPHSANYLGRSLYAADKYFKGKMRDVRIYNRALASSDVAALPGN